MPDETAVHPLRPRCANPHRRGHRARGVHAAEDTGTRGL